MNVVREINKINERELELGTNLASWHDEYKDSAYIFVGGLNFDLTEGDVITIFSQYGEVMDVNLPRDKETGKTKGFGFLMYEDQRSTVLAVDNLNGAKVLERTLRVDHVRNYKQPKVKGEEGEWIERDEQSLNARPMVIIDDPQSDSSESSGPEIDPEDPMAAYLLEQRRKEKMKKKAKKSKRKHENETPEERRARKARRSEKKAVKASKKSVPQSVGLRGVEELLQTWDSDRSAKRTRSRSSNPIYMRRISLISTHTRELFFSHYIMGNRILDLVVVSDTMRMARAPSAKRQGRQGPVLPRDNNCFNPDPQNTLTDRMNSALNSSGNGFILSLCPNTNYNLVAPLLFAFPDQEISTKGYPTDDSRAMLVVNGAISNNTGQTTAVDGSCSTCSGVKLRNIQNNDIGPCGTDAFQQWSDGISFACANGIVRNNLVDNPTDGGIVLFGAPGTLVENNTIWIEEQTLLGGINMVDYLPWNGNFTGVVVQNNSIYGGFATDNDENNQTKGDDAFDAIIKIGIAIGPRTWFGGRYGNNKSQNAVVINNHLSGAFGYGIALTSAQNFTVEGNSLFGNTSFIGSRGPNCSSVDTTPSTQGFVIENNTTQSSTTQTDFQAITDGSSLTCIVPPSDGDFWPYGGSPESSSPSGHSESEGTSTGTKVGMALGITFGVIFVALLAWYIRRWALARQSRVRTGARRQAGFMRGKL
ncbi:hypothetical protein EW145_g634 [Phellinidium pouzarii]|uniref:RRM domain-containing protein n=1 Tax=Phellinidium pouzarii TaxID=167371 RepID=A0A4S4LIB1_9AGAM|nr:hypothetical protein EW145_g634 [Phellinidium pouzarii]